MATSQIDCQNNNDFEKNWEQFYGLDFSFQNTY